MTFVNSSPLHMVFLDQDYLGFILLDEPIQFLLGPIRACPILPIPGFCQGCHIDLQYADGGGLLALPCGHGPGLGNLWVRFGLMRA